MATTLKIADHHIFQFTKNVELLLQQQDSRFSNAVTTGTYEGASAQVVLQYGDINMKKITAGVAAGNWTGDTEWSEIEHHQRWVLPADFAVSLPIAHQDVLRMLVDPQSGYARAIQAAHNRTIDNLVATAALGPAQTGEITTPVSTALPATQIIAAGTTSLTIEKLIEAREKLDAAMVDPSEERFIAVTAKQISSLLKTTEVTNSNYNTIRALVQGELDTFVGFKFIQYEGLPLATTTRQCIAWAKSGLHLGVWDNLMVRIDERPDKNYARQIYARRTLGATRTQEKKVVQVNCTE